MNIYKTKLNIQNFGSAWLIILRGKLQDVKETFNSFYNLNGANGSIDISENAADAIGVFWSNEKAMRRYWQNRFLLAFPSENETLVYNGKCEPANSYVEIRLEEMFSNQENFMTFDTKYMPIEHGMGKISAESPDLSFREAAHQHISKIQSEIEV